MYNNLQLNNEPLGRGVIPHRQYSLRAFRGTNWCDSGTDSIVWMKKGTISFLRISVQITQG